MPSIFKFCSASTGYEQKASRWNRSLQQRERQYHLRKQRTRKSSKSKNDFHSQNQSKHSQEDQATMEVNTDEVAVWQDGDSDVLKENHQGQDNEESAELCDDNSSTLDCDDQQVDIADTRHTCTSTKSDIGIKTDFNWESWCTMQETIKFQQEIIAMLSAELKEALSHSQRLERDDQQTHYYTGLTSYAVFNNLSEILGSVLSRNPNTTPVKEN